MSNINALKLDRMLRIFAAGSKLHRFQAEKYGDHCLPTTISDLQKRHGILFSRKSIKVKNRFGSYSNVMLYWLESGSLQTARIACRLESAA